MTWQTPKTNWTSADGVRDSDFNRIEENIRYLYNMHARSAVTLYVSPPPNPLGGGGNGSDSTGDGSASKPYATIQHAINQLPKSSNGMTVTINVAAGTYNENVVVADFNGCINISGIFDAVVSIQSLRVRACSCNLSAIHLRVSAGINIEYGATLTCTARLTITGGSNGINVNRGSACVIDSTLSISGTSGAAVTANNASTVYLTTFTVANASVLLDAQHGSIIAYGSTTHTVSSVTFVTRTGGRIYTGAQAQTNPF